ncbi:MAG: hypothetical protein R3B95_10305 [Nitrospirales bacterium]|nr:hypothetical protein [Nitrospira sp.]MDR4483594.1 hypothetical protein [Nitrospirales bacterium]
MRNCSQHKNVFGIALLFGSLAGGFLIGEVSEAQKIPFFDRNVVLLDCVESAANTFVVDNMSSTVDVEITRGLDCAAAVQKLLVKGYVLGPGAGGVTSGEATALDHFLMVFLLNPNDLLEPRIDTSTINPSRDCVVGQNSQSCSTNVEKSKTLSPTINRQEPLSPILQSPQSPIIQRRSQ